MGRLLGYPRVGPSFEGRSVTTDVEVGSVACLRCSGPKGRIGFLHGMTRGAMESSSLLGYGCLHPNLAQSQSLSRKCFSSLLPQHRLGAKSIFACSVDFLIRLCAMHGVLVPGFFYGYLTVFSSMYG
jgi:hypothetical protein